MAMILTEQGCTDEFRYERGEAKARRADDLVGDILPAATAATFAPLLVRTWPANRPVLPRLVSVPLAFGVFGEGEAGDLTAPRGDSNAGLALLVPAAAPRGDNAPFADIPMAVGDRISGGRGLTPVAGDAEPAGLKPGRGESAAGAAAAGVPATARGDSAAAGVPGDGACGTGTAATGGGPRGEGGAAASPLGDSIPC